MEVIHSQARVRMCRAPGTTGPAPLAGFTTAPMTAAAPIHSPAGVLTHRVPESPQAPAAAAAVAAAPIPSRVAVLTHPAPESPPVLAVEAAPPAAGVDTRPLLIAT